VQARIDSGTAKLLAETLPIFRLDHVEVIDVLAVGHFNRQVQLRAGHNFGIATGGFTALRIPSIKVYGPRMDLDGVYTEVLIRWIDAIQSGVSPKIFGDGTQSMDFVYVEDVARANVAGLVSDATDEVFNVGTGIQTSLNQLVELLLKVCGSSLTPQHLPARTVNNVQARRAAVEKAENLLGFKASVDLQSGLQRLVEWCEHAKAEMALVGGGVK